MQQSQLLLGLLSENEVSLKQQVQLWDSSGVWTTIGGKIRKRLGAKFLKWLSFSGNWKHPFESLCNPHLADFQLMKLSRLMDAAGVPFPYKPNPTILEDCTNQIEERAVEFLRDSDEDFTGSTTQDLTRYVIEKTFEEFTEKFCDADLEMQDEIAGKILDAIDSLDEQCKHRLLDEMNIEELHNDQLIKLLASGGFATGLAATVSVSGFAAYTAVTTSIFAVSSLIGVTFPFAVYMYATAGLAFVTHPATIVLGGVGLGAWLTSKSNKVIYQRLAPMLVAFSCINQTTHGTTDNAMATLVQHIKDTQDELAFGEKERRKLLVQCFPGIEPS